MSGAVQSIEPAALARRIAEGAELVLLDVRQAEEVLLVRMKGARHVPLQELPARLGELDPRAELVCICHHGLRSAHAAAFLLQQGFERVLNLAGGIDRWAVEVDPSLTRY